MKTVSTYRWSFLAILLVALCVLTMLAFAPASATDGRGSGQENLNVSLLTISGARPISPPFQSAKEGAGFTWDEPYQSPYDWNIGWLQIPEDLQEEVYYLWSLDSVTFAENVTLYARLDQGKLYLEQIVVEGKPYRTVQYVEGAARNFSVTEKPDWLSVEKNGKALNVVVDNENILSLKGDSAQLLKEGATEKVPEHSLLVFYDENGEHIVTMWQNSKLVFLEGDDHFVANLGWEVPYYYQPPATWFPTEMYFFVDGTPYVQPQNQ